MSNLVVSSPIDTFMQAGSVPGMLSALGTAALAKYFDFAPTYLFDARAISGIADGAAISLLPDVVAGNNATINGTAGTWKYRSQGINRLPGVEYVGTPSGASCFVTRSNLSITGAVTIFMVMKMESAVSYLNGAIIAQVGGTGAAAGQNIVMGTENFGSANVGSTNDLNNFQVNTGTSGAQLANAYIARMKPFEPCVVALVVDPANLNNFGGWTGSAYFTGQPTASVWLNGVCQQSVQMSSSSSTVTGPVYIGDVYQNGAFNGIYSHFAVYPSAFSPAQIKEMFALLQADYRPRRPKVLIAGDSLSYGGKASVNKNPAALLQQSLPLVETGYCINGGTPLTYFASMLTNGFSIQNFADLVNSVQEGDVVWIFGQNDLLSTAPISQTANLTSGQPYVNVGTSNQNNINGWYAGMLLADTTGSGSNTIGSNITISTVYGWYVTASGNAIASGTGRTISAYPTVASLENAAPVITAALQARGAKVIWSKNPPTTVASGSNVTQSAFDTARGTWNTWCTTANTGANFIFDPTSLTNSETGNMAGFSGTGAQQLAFTGVSLTSANTTVSVSSTSGLSVGASVSGGSIPAAATVASIVDGTHFTVSAAPTTTQSGQTVTVTNAWYSSDGVHYNDTGNAALVAALLTVVRQALGLAS